MSLPQKLETYFLNDKCIEIYVPEERAIQQLYRNNKQDAYWAKVWPASVGLCLFLEQYPHLIRDKKILELAAGLGLSGLHAAPLAQHVTITDREPLAEVFVKQSALRLGLKNVTTKTLDWKDAAQEPLPQVVLLSDVNYEPPVFNVLQKIIDHFITNRATVIISTPQRLVAKQFIETLLPYKMLHWNETILLNKAETAVSVFVLNRVEQDINQ
ncbi:class I SAM-dependent methyltransferase [Niabella hibiscisoli]|uniref:class I SAM-dependent methyltransferase n=1 Tax=Niabella hibiscisoli TaxID=1825928 RepID=UPI001F0F7245|nr:protein N-lysine methyltransferase family protein [Niabella hibiscisoli]MCH5715228.1 protein N-lysine methyltransferase family protein [Niabella hibiscisoli]